MGMSYAAAISQYSPSKRERLKKITLPFSKYKQLRENFENSKRFCLAAKGFNEKLEQKLKSTLSLAEKLDGTYVRNGKTLPYSNIFKMHFSKRQNEVINLASNFCSKYDPKLLSLLERDKYCMDCDTNFAEYLLRRMKISFSKPVESYYSEQPGSAFRIIQVASELNNPGKPGGPNNPVKPFTRLLSDTEFQEYGANQLVRLEKNPAAGQANLPKRLIRRFMGIFSEPVDGLFSETENESRENRAGGPEGSKAKRSGMPVNRIALIRQNLPSKYQPKHKPTQEMIQEGFESDIAEFEKKLNTEMDRVVSGACLKVKKNPTWVDVRAFKMQLGRAESRIFNASKKLLSKYPEASGIRAGRHERLMLELAREISKGAPFDIRKFMKGHDAEDEQPAQSALPEFQRPATTNFSSVTAMPEEKNLAAAVTQQNNGKTGFLSFMINGDEVPMPKAKPEHANKGEFLRRLMKVEPDEGKPKSLLRTGTND